MVTFVSANLIKYIIKICMLVNDLSNNVVNRNLKTLAYGQSRVVRTFNGYFVNGFRFHTQDYGQIKKTINSGVCVRGNCD